MSKVAILCVDTGVLDPARVALASFSEHHPDWEVRVYCHDPKVREAFPEAIVMTPRLEVQLPRKPRFGFKATQAAMMRLEVVQHLLEGDGLEVALYLDADTFTQRPFADEIAEGEEWTVKVRPDRPFADDPDFPYYDEVQLAENDTRHGLYFNTGVMLFHLGRIREQGGWPDLLDEAQASLGKHLLPDQGFLNDYLDSWPVDLLPEGVNVGAETVAMSEMPVMDLLRRRQWARRQPLLHYFGMQKPWNADSLGRYACQVPFDDYLAYAQEIEGIDRGFLDRIEDHDAKLKRRMGPLLEALEYQNPEYSWRR